MRKQKKKTSVKPQNNLLEIDFSVVFNMNENGLWNSPWIWMCIQSWEQKCVRSTFFIPLILIIIGSRISNPMNTIEPIVIGISIRCRMLVIVYTFYQTSSVPTFFSPKLLKIIFSDEICFWRSQKKTGKWI